MSDKNLLVSLPTQDPVKLFTQENIDQVLDAVQQHINQFNYDLSTQASRKRIASLAFKVSQVKTRLDKIGKDLVADWKAQAKAVDETRKYLRDALDNLKATARQPLTEWEEQEEARQAALQEKLEQLMRMRETSDEEGNPLNSKQLTRRLEQLTDIRIGDDWEDFREKAEKIKKDTILFLKTAIFNTKKLEAKAAAERKAAREAEIARQKAEAEAEAKRKAEQAKRLAEAEAKRKAAEEAAKQAEIARQAAEKEAARQAEIARRAAAEKAAAEAEAARKAKAAREAAEKEAAEQKAKAQAEMQRRIEEAKQQATAEAEAQRKAEETARLAAETKAAREAEATRKAVESEVLQALTNLFPENAQAIFAAIKAGKIPHVSIG